jgi:hypothetical protein
MTEIKKHISADDRLKFIGLMKMAHEHVRETRKIELAIIAMLGIEEGGHLSDNIYGRYEPNDTIAQLDRILLLEGIGVEDTV